MRTILLILIYLITTETLPAQSMKEHTIHSVILKEQRKIKVISPYLLHMGISCPVIFIFFNPVQNLVAEHVAFFSQEWYDKIPSSIVVYIPISETSADNDIGLSYSTGKLSSRGQQFHDHILTEVIPFINKEYPAGLFRIALGHSYGANYVNHLFEHDPEIFRGFILLAPEKPDYEVNFNEAVAKVKNPTYYFLAAAEKDVPQRIEYARSISDQLNTQKHPFFQFTYLLINNADHISITPYALNIALEYIFKDYHQRESMSRLSIDTTLQVEALYKKLEKENQFNYNVSLRINTGNSMYFLNLCTSRKDKASLDSISNFYLNNNPTANRIEIIGNFYEENGYPQRAEALFRLAIEQYKSDGRNADTHNAYKYLVRYIYMDGAKNQEKAWLTAQEALNIANITYFEYLLGEIAATFHYKTKQGIQYLEKYIAHYESSRSPYDPVKLENAYYQLAMCYKHQQNNTKAKEMLKKSLLINQTFEPAILLLKTINK
jgi:hypothetical protein